jgi:hypothetical protein
MVADRIAAARWYQREEPGHSFVLEVNNTSKSAETGNETQPCNMPSKSMSILKIVD